MNIEILLKTVFKYLIMGCAVALAAFWLPRKELKLDEILMIGAMSAATFAVLENFAPEVYKGSMFGSGFGIGSGLGPGMENFRTITRPECSNVVSAKGRDICFQWKNEGNGPEAIDCVEKQFF